MFLKHFAVYSNYYRKYLFTGVSKCLVTDKLLPRRHYGCFTIFSNCNIQSFNKIRIRESCFCTLNLRKYSNKLLDGDVTELQNAQKEKELTKIGTIFPQPRVTLNELQSKTPNSIFDIHYKQNVVTPKGGRKKAIQNDWTCTYAFVWPQKIKFESTAISKRQAAEKAALQALHWLHTNKRIDNKGSPIYDKTVLDELNRSLNQPIEASISEKSMLKIEQLWVDYNKQIKPIYDATFEAAKRRVIRSPVILNKDSTIEEDEMYEEDPDSTYEAELSGHKFIHPVYGRHVTPASISALERRNKQLRRTFKEYDSELMPLPIDEYADIITSTVRESRVVVLVGAAGCGKSTRAPVAILRQDGGSVAAIVSGPRRVAAVGLARRVASELHEQVGDTVGYQVRLDSNPPRPPAGSILYCTSGVLLKRLQANPGLEGCTHVFIDEAHERDVNTDITLLLLKRAIQINTQLRVVVMSATLDTNVFTRYFDKCPVIEVPGRTFPVEISYLNDIQKRYNLSLSNTMENCAKEDGRPAINCQEVVQVIRAVDKAEPEGAILLFLPGWAEIKQTKSILDQCFDGTTHMILPVHSRLSTTDQAKMFSKPMPGVRKIVLATNIAETSVTIPDVVYVIDSGAHRENRLREGTGTASLESVWVSRAGAQQRTGRAGRVQPGHCFKLYTQEKENEFAPFTTPEILRVPLEPTVLDCKSYAPDDKVEDFLSQLPEPPSHQAIQFAVKDLIDLEALTNSEHLTRLGLLLSSLSVHPRLGKALLAGAVAGTALAAAGAVQLLADGVEVFRDAPDRRGEIREIKRSFNATSDHLALYRLQEEFESYLEDKGWRGVDSWCERYGLRKDRLGFVKSLTNLHLQQLLNSPMLLAADPQELGQFSHVDELTAAALLHGANALLVTRGSIKTKGKLKTERQVFTSKGERAHIGSESVNHDIKRRRGAGLLCYFGGHHSTERRALVVRRTTLITPHTVVLFSPGDVSVKESNDETAVVYLPRHKLHVNIPTSQVDKILHTREMILNTINYYIERDPKKISYEENETVSSFKVNLMKTVSRILVEEQEKMVLNLGIPVDK